MTAWLDVWAEHQGNVGFVEGPNNKNPWGPEQGVKNAAYCASAATIIPHHKGVVWWPESQFGAKGFAYTPYWAAAAKTHGLWKGADGDLRPGDIVALDWNHDGVGDHTETVVAAYKDGTFDTIGYNTGKPEGCHYPIRRDRKYLLGRLRMEGALYSTVTPPPVGGSVMPGYPFRTTSAQIQDWTSVDGHSWIIDSNGAVYGSPGSPGIIGVNGQPYFAGRTAAKLHIQMENTHYVCTIEATSGEMYRADGGAPFRTH